MSSCAVSSSHSPALAHLDPSPRSKRSHSHSSAPHSRRHSCSVVTFHLSPDDSLALDPSNFSQSAPVLVPIDISSPRETATAATSSRRNSFTASTPSSHPHHHSLAYTIRHYFKKYSGDHARTPPRLQLIDQFLAFIASFLGIFIPALLHFYVLDPNDFAYLVASFGASAVLLYSAPESPLAQPRNLIGGHIIAAFLGVCIRKLIFVEQTARFLYCLASAFSVSVSIAVMNVTRTLHPPAAASALIAVLPNSRIQDIGFYYVLVPIASGAVTMLIVALIVNNLHPKKNWPKRWT